MAAQATFSWLPNSETNLAGYKVYYGISSRNYTNVIDAGLPAPVNGRIQATVDNLIEGETYYFAATAYDSNGLESDYSIEIIHTVPAAVDSITKIFGNTPGADYPGTLADTFTNINDQVLDGSETLSTWSWSSPSPHKVANTIILKTNLSTIPASATIVEARLYLYQTATQGETSYSNTVHKITGHNPVIGEVSGTNAAAGTAWNSVPAGTTYNDIPLGLADIAPAEDTATLDNTNGYRSWLITSMVRDWVADPQSNYGLLVNGQSEMATETGRTFAASENSNTDIRPKLVITYTINSSTTPPAAANSSVSGNEDTPVTGALSVDNPSGLPLQYAVPTNPVHGTLTIENATGQFTYHPLPDFNGRDSFSFTATNDNGISNTATITITVNPLNDPPVAQTASFATDEDTALSGQLNASDIDGDTLNYALVAQPGSGTVTVNANRTFTYTPTGNANGTDTFTFKVSDGTADSNTATISITVNPVNDPPVAQAASLATDEDTALSGQLNASDIDGDTLSYALVAQPGSGTVTVNANGTFTYTPTGNANGTDTFTFKVNDGTADSSIATITITVNPVNDTPTADNQSLSVVAGSTTSGLLTAADPDGDNLTFAVASAAAQGDVSINADGTFTYTARQDAAGTDSFTFTANDGSSGSNIATVAITLTESTTGFRFELHELQVDSNWQAVSYDSPFTNPVVIAGASSFTSSETGVIRVKNVTSNGLELRFQEWDSLDGQHPVETITLMVAEAGTFTLDDGTLIEAGCFSTSGASTFSALSFLQPMSTPPVVMTAVNTVNETDAVTTRVRNITTNGFEFMMREQEINATTHAEETACYLAWEPSTGRFGNMQYEVAVTGDQITANAYPIKYTSRFIELPMVLAAMQTTDGGDTATPRINTSTIEGIDVFVSEEQSRDSELAHTTERGGYISIAAYDPAGDPDGDTLSTSDEESIYNTHPGVADTDHDGIDDGAEITYWQEQGSSWYADLDNDGLINLLDQDSDNDGMADGSEIAAGFDPADPASVPGFPIMDGGEVDVDSTWVRVNFTTTFTNPVIIARLVSKNGGDPCVVRIDNVTATGFDLRLQEYEYLDGTHTVEQVSYLVMEAGHYTLADGTQVEAGTFSTSATSTYDSRSFNQTFSQTPVVITSVDSSNEADTVTARIRNINTNGFECKLQEQEINTKSHLIESLAYIAWEPSSGSENGLRYEVGRSADTVTHATKTLSYAAGFNTRPLLYTDMQTTDGGDTSTLRTISNEAAGLQVLVEEEQSKDSKVAHTTEVAGFIAILSE